MDFIFLQNTPPYFYHPLHLKNKNEKRDKNIQTELGGHLCGAAEVINKDSWAGGKKSTTLSSVERSGVSVFHNISKSLHGATFLTQRYVLCLQHLAVVDVHPGYDEEVIRGAGFDVTKTQQLVILWTENVT